MENPKIILPGVLIRNLAGIILDASSTVALIQTNDSGFILVDTGERSRRTKLVDALKSKAGIDPSDIEHLIITHRHHDHNGNRDLFTNAVFYLHSSERTAKDNNDDRIITVSEGFELAKSPRVYIIETPGHTKGSITIIVESEHVYGITGDALPLEDNYSEWVPPGINFNPKIALQSMERIRKIADYVIPGHDRMFKID